MARCESKDLLGEVFVDGSEPFLRGIQRGRPTWIHGVAKISRDSGGLWIGSRDAIHDA